MRKLAALLLALVLMSGFSLAYERGAAGPVHEHITNQSQKVWKLIPAEITDHLTNSFNRPLDGNYDPGDDIISGAAEEDHTINPRNHFWEPDDPDTVRSGNDDYDDGIATFGSSYRRATEFWETQVIPAYIRGDVNESYYWLGRTAHLLEDAAQPSHVHKDAHTGHLGDGTSVLESWTAGNYTRYNGSTYSNKEYYAPSPISGFNWTPVQPTRSPDVHFPELFRLFWFTAQKTQYWASDDVDGGVNYTDLNYANKNFTCTGSSSLNLWAAEGYTSCSNILSNHNNLAANVESEANATVPHAMKATAGLYRLFWDTVHSYEWPFLYHDLQRTGATRLKGDLNSVNNIRTATTNLQTGVDGSEEFSRIGIGNLEGEDIFNRFTGENEVVVTTDRGFNLVGGSTYAYHFNSFTNQYVQDWKWSFPIGVVAGAPSIEDFDSSDDNKEVIFGLTNGTLFALDGPTNATLWSCTVPLKHTNYLGMNLRGHLANFAVADIDSDGTKEIIFTDSVDTTIYDWPGDLYVFSENGAQTMGGCGSAFKLEDNESLSNPGSFDPPSVANVDSDKNLEIIVPTYYELYVYDYDGTTLSKKWSVQNGLIDGSVVVFDLDKDGENELIYTTTNQSCSPFKSSICSNKLWVRNASNGQLEWSATLSMYSRVPPAIADLDLDGDYEIVVTGFKNQFFSQGDAGKVMAFDSAGNQVWSFDDSGALGVNFVSVSLADIDGDGKYNVLFPNNSTKLYVLDDNGVTKYTKTMPGAIGSPPAIGMISRKHTAEIAMKHAGSPITNLTLLTGTNDIPLLNNVSNITANAGDLININGSGQITATDPNGDPLTFYYGTPFNSSGLWQTDENSTGNYTVVIEASDGNLTDWLTINVEVKGSNSSNSSSNVSSISVSLVSPSANVNVTRNQFFSFTTQVCCTGADCGQINVSLDPEKTEYTYTSEKHCVGNECTTTLYSTPRYGFEDGEWKPLENLKSFKGTVPIICDVANDGIHEVECLDYNATHRQLRISIKDEKLLGQPVPIRILEPTVEENALQFTEDLDAREELTFTSTSEAKEQWFAVDYADQLHVGETSTNVTYLPNVSAINGWWESTGGSLALYSWSDCDANAYSGADKSAISVNTTAASIYGQGGGSATDYTYCHRIQWNITEAPSNITRIWAYSRWTGSLNPGGADSITKALYIGNVTGHTWKALNVKTSAWGEEQHSGEITSSITDFVNGTASGNYIYTLLHMNASKPSSTYAYSNYYYAELQITSGSGAGGGGSSTKNGLVSTTAGTTPFYTNGTNPRNISLNGGQCQNVTWYVNATGNLSTTHTFFAYANKTSNMSVNNRTTSINITISNTSSSAGWTVTDTDTFASSDEGWTGGSRDTTAQTYNSSGDWGTIRKNYTLTVSANVVNLTINDFWYADDTSDPKIFVPGDTASDNDYLLFDGTKPNINWKHVDDGGGYGECNQDIVGTVTWADGDSISIVTNYTSGQWCTYHNGQKCRCETSTLAHGDNFEVNVGNAHVVAVDNVEYSQFQG